MKIKCSPCEIKLRINIRYPNILTYGCSSHYLNLLEKEVTPNSVLKHIVEIKTNGWLKEMEEKLPQLSNDTRWNSQLELLLSVFGKK